MFLNIITPCSRPENLIKISESINIPRESYRWIVVFDNTALPEKELIPDNCEVYLHVDNNSIVGHAQRNYALDLIKEGHVYFNDDDTIIHSNLWENIKDVNSKFISFIQEDKNRSIRLVGNNISVGQIDSHNFILDNSIIGKSRFIVNRYDADGVFANECFKKTKSYTHIPKILSTYNFLR